MNDTLLPHHLETLARLEHLCAAARAALPGEPTPCFGHLQLETAAQTRDLLLGWRTVTDDAVTILHWQTAPLAALFFANRVGDAYELTVAGRLLEGTVRARNLLDFAAGELVEVVTPDAVLSRRGGGPWRRDGGATVSLLSPRALSAPHVPPPWTLEALDADQRRGVQLPPGRAALVLGEAGCGKTTVALHRVAELQRRAARAGAPFRGLVLVPVEGLRRLSETLLARLGVPGIDVRAFDRWAAVQARRVFPGVPRRESHNAPAAAVRLKRHPALRAAIARVARRRPKGGGPTRATASRDDLLHLFGDRVLMDQVAAASGGVVSPYDVRYVLDHTRVQFNTTAEDAFSHVEAERLASTDGLLLDAGTPMEDAGTVDPEDHAVLFALAACRAGPGAPAPRPDRYDCVVLDEAQEFAPLELELIGRALGDGATLVVAGDDGQQVDPTAYFAGWAATMRELGAPDYETVRLAVSYRCPPAVTTLARGLVHPVPAGAEALSRAVLPPGDPAVVTYAAPNECHLVARMADGLRELRTYDPSASAAVVCRTPEAAARMAGLLGRGVDLRLVRDGDFGFAAGVEVTCVQEVRGLEFGFVVVPDANTTQYPDGDEARRALYVAVTRASHQLVLAATGTWTPVLHSPPRG